MEKLTGHLYISRDNKVTNWLILTLPVLRLKRRRYVPSNYAPRSRAHKRHLIATYVTSGNQDVNSDIRHEIDTLSDAEQNEYTYIQGVWQRSYVRSCAGKIHRAKWKESSTICKTLSREIWRC